MREHVCKNCNYSDITWVQYPNGESENQIICHHPNSPYRVIPDVPSYWCPNAAKAKEDALNIRAKSDGGTQVKPTEQEPQKDRFALIDMR